MRHIFIINPIAGGRDSTSRIMEAAKALQERHGIAYECILTRRPGHAMETCRALAEGGEALRFYACGGDGTVNEVANGILGFPNAAMTCIPAGTGNDFMKNFGPEMAGRFQDIESLWDGPQFPLDAIDCNGRIALTIACSGIDAQIADTVHRYGKSTLLGGRGSYLASVAVNFLFHDIGHQWTVTLDDEVLSDNFALVSTCNGRYYGGGSTPVPQARMDDGVLETILVRKVGKLTFARLFPAYSAGECWRFPDIARVVRARTVRIQSDTKIVTCLDGESLYSNDVTIRLSEKKVNFFGPRGCDPNATARPAAGERREFMNKL